MTGSRLIIIQHLGLATAQASRTDPGWLDDCERHLVRALIEVQRIRSPFEQDSVRLASWPRSARPAKGRGRG